MFGGAQVPIVEDEMLIAFDLADEVERAGGKVIGPFSSVGAALRALRSESVEGAIPTPNLADRDIAPVAIALINQGIPVIIHTGRASRRRSCASRPTCRFGSSQHQLKTWWPPSVR